MLFKWELVLILGGLNSGILLYKKHEVPLHKKIL